MHNHCSKQISLSDISPDAKKHILLLALNMKTFCRYLPGPDDVLVLDIAYVIYLKFEEFPNALQIALFLDNMQVLYLLACVRQKRWNHMDMNF